MKAKTLLWIKAMRLFSLPMSVSAVMLGAGFASVHGSFSWTVSALSLLTVSAMHILCNLANDYGDAQNGADGTHRIA